MATRSRNYRFWGWYKSCDIWIKEDSNYIRVAVANECSYIFSLDTVAKNPSDSVSIFYRNALEAFLHYVEQTKDPSISPNSR